MHDWKDLGVVDNDNPFAGVNDPDKIHKWKCSKCKWEVTTAAEAEMPPFDKKFYRKMPGGPEEWYSCDELIALGIHES